MKYWHLFFAFFRVGMLGYGGGPSSIPLVHREVVHKYKWLNDNDFGDVLALGNTLPGPIATKMAGYIGYRVAGVLGAVIAALTTVLPTITLMIVLLTVLASFKDQAWVVGMTRGVTPVVGVMLAKLAYDFFKRAHSGLGLWTTLLLIVGGFVVMEVLHLHPGLVIAGLFLFAILKPDRKQSGQSEEKGE